MTYLPGYPLLMFNAQEDDMRISQACLVFAMAALALVGCATTPESRLRAAADGSDGGGLAIVGMTLSGKPLNEVNSFEYSIRRITATRDDEMTIEQRVPSPVQRVRQTGASRDSDAAYWSLAVVGPGTPDAADLVEDDALVGRVLALSLPAGDYEIFDWRIIENGTAGEHEHGPAQSFSYRFSVVPGRTVYLGRLHLALSTTRKQAIDIENRRDADLAALWQRYPALASTPVVVDLLQP